MRTTYRNQLLNTKSHVMTGYNIDILPFKMLHAMYRHDVLNRDLSAKTIIILDLVCSFIIYMYTRRHN